MRVALVVGGMPSRGTSGDSVVMRTVIERLRALEHEVAVTVLLTPADIAESAAWIDEAESELRALGVAVSRLTIELPPPDADLAAAVFPEGSAVEAVQAALAQSGPDVVVGFDTGILLALRGYLGAPVFGIPGDPRHLVWRYQVLGRPWRERLSRAWVQELLRYRRGAALIEETLVECARSCAAAGMFGAQHAAWLRSLGVPCAYLPLPIRDRRPAGGVVRAQGTRLRILHLGGLGTTGTRLGFDLLVRVVLPRLERDLGPNGYALRIVGSGSLSPGLARRLARPGVEVVGFVDDTAAEIAGADVFLVPSPYPVGARTRIAEALSIGVAVVAHADAATGIPELVDGDNALLAATGSGLAEAVLRLARDPELRDRLAVAARATYDRNFVPEIACDVLVRELERLAGQVR